MGIDTYIKPIYAGSFTLYSLILESYFCLERLTEPPFVYLAAV